MRPAGDGWQHWREQVPKWVYPRAEQAPRFSELVVPTLDSVRYERLLSLLHSVGKARLSPAHQTPH